MTKRAFGELESQILYMLKSGERQTVKDVHKAFGGNDNYNTVMTVMSRLAEKKTACSRTYWITIRVLAAKPCGLIFIFR